MRFQISLAQHEDMASWLRLAEEVVPLFGPMPDFETVLIRKIAQRQAFCAKAESMNLNVLGGVLFGGSGTDYAIRWLAVSSQHQRLGIGKALISTALSAMPPECTVHVDTFVEGSPGAEPARGLYESCGFVPGDVSCEGRIVRQRYVLRPRMIGHDL